MVAPVSDPSVGSGSGDRHSDSVLVLGRILYGIITQREKLRRKGEAMNGIEKARAFYRLFTDGRRTPRS